MVFKRTFTKAEEEYFNLELNNSKQSYKNGFKNGILALGALSLSIVISMAFKEFHVLLKSFTQLSLPMMVCGIAFFIYYLAHFKVGINRFEKDINEGVLSNIESKIVSKRTGQNGITSYKLANGFKIESFDLGIDLINGIKQNDIAEIGDKVNYLILPKDGFIIKSVLIKSP